jgi:hypothetical protein
VKQLTDGVWQLGGFPPNAIDIYVLSDILVDANGRFGTRLPRLYG